MLIAILTIGIYICALLLIVPTLVKVDHQSEKKANAKLILLIGMIAVVLHLINLYQHLFLNVGQNFTLVNVISLICVLMSLIATLALPKWKTLWFPLPILYTLSMISIILSTFVEGNFIKQLSENIGLLFHLCVAIFSYALFFIALLYALQLKWLDRNLRSKKMSFSPLLPPLMTVEHHFFMLIFCGQIALTVALITGMIYLHNFFAPEQIHKAIFSFIGWIVYSILLLGQWKFHWRGNRVLIYSISGMMLLTIAYFGSRVV